MPFILDRPEGEAPILFAHIPKTGGNWAREALGLRKIYGAHGPPAEASWLIDSHRVVAHIRDPWSWYGSVYCHLVAMGRNSRLAQWGNGSTAFEDVLAGWLDPLSVEVLPEPVGPLWAPYGPGPHPPLAGGLWSWTYATFLGDLDATLIDLATVAEGWSELLGEPASAAAPVNVRGAWDYRDLYPRKLRERVRSADRDLIVHCGYHFLKPAKAGPLIDWPRR